MNGFAMGHSAPRHQESMSSFVLTRSGGGATPRGRALLERQRRQGHVLALDSMVIERGIVCA